MAVELPADFFLPRNGPSTTREESPTTEVYRPRWITPPIAQQLRHEGVPEDVVPRSVPAHQRLRYESFTSCYYEQPESAALVLANGCTWYRLTEVCALRTKVYWVQASRDVLVDSYAGAPSTSEVWILVCPGGTPTREQPGGVQHPDTSLVPFECTGSAYAYSVPSGNVLGREYVWVLRPPLVFSDECNATATYVLNVRDTVTSGPVAATAKGPLSPVVPEQTATATYYVCVDRKTELVRPEAPLKESLPERKWLSGPTSDGSD